MISVSLCLVCPVICYLAAVTRLTLWPCALIMFVVTRLGIRWWGQARSGAFYTSTVTGPLTCTRHYCVSSLLMPLISVTLCHYYYWSSAPITGYHWGSFIPPCNQGQFVTMSNEKMPVSSGWYLPITRCLTASWLPCTIAPHDTLRIRRFILAHSRFKNRTSHFLRRVKIRRFTISHSL